MKRILIIGSGVAGRDILREIKKSPELGIEVLGFIDDDSNKQNKIVNGIKVLGTRDKIKRIVSSKKIDQVIIAIPSAEGEQVSDLVRICSDSGVSFQIVPRVKEIIEGKAYFNTLRQVQVEDLLGRPVVKSDVFELQKFFKNKIVLVTGAAGSIGSELSRQIAAYKPKLLVLFDWWENGLYEIQLEMKRVNDDIEIEFVIGNMQDRQKVKLVMEHYKPDYVFHAAAYKHVPLMEANPTQAVKNNVFGTLNLVEEARDNNVDRFVLVSTDKAAEPASIMGATKLIAEGIVKSINSKTKFMTVRFGNVLDSYGSVVPVFRKQIERGGPLTITDERMTRYFMTIPEAAQLILKSAKMGKGGELFVLDMGLPVKILDLAKNLIRLSGRVPGKDIDIVFTGIRPGEKINERLFNQEEALQATKAEKIFITESLGLDLISLPKLLKKLRRYTNKEDSQKIREEVSKLFKSSSND